MILQKKKKKLGKTSSQELYRNGNISNSNLYEEQELNNILKKFHYIILQLQNEVSNQALTIYNLTEENKMLREQQFKQNGNQI